ncbi:hypothetical protein [Mucilaginibacter polytrichastri]|uniref:DUF5672 domain-containing protein n=1 Tax=Mucilaginibacter polytrichastri TaxID=1302689 RepID=A0A1Q5ZTP8_9SPHI|nr:hypothetical protein [Mucilaginibacter polytrichastri]OKS85136.1 hypothetical protein RG47T_0580 [Mucilaginibacter polytrichastri]SFS43937.1 hypothetical protein SAMN04487890_101503 [Mucilaginibacter polytrichastri]
MSSIVCTLFEKNYHYGIAGLVNSLYKQGYKGEIFVGYKGALPKWAEGKSSSSFNWVGSTTLNVTNDIEIHFLPLDTEYHLTNYKATFMLKLWRDLRSDCTNLFYFDPDIVIKCRWSFYEEWVNHGVAMVHEIVSNDLPFTHPIRMEWTKVIHSIGKIINHQVSAYINGGFCGVNIRDIEFLETWEKLIDTAINVYKADPKKFSSFDRTYPFWSIDQDAFNITAMCTTSPISEMGPEGMDLTYGGWTMSHATGTPKPWSKKFISNAFKGKAPSLPDNLYWLNMQGAVPLNVHSKAFIKYKVTSMLIAKFIGRFYHRP